MERELYTYPTWKKYTVLAHAVANLTVKERRAIFSAARTAQHDTDPFFPEYGLTFSEFALFYTLGDTRRAKDKPGD
jgi:hypothetical protein